MDIVQPKYDLEKYYLKDDGIFPNSELPVLFYKGVLSLPALMPGYYIRRLFQKNNWTNSWRDGIYTHHHYHSITHEVIGVCQGQTTLLLGGDEGIKVNLEKGDVLVLPAGVAHKNLFAKDQIKCIGAYPEGKPYDMNYGSPSERPKADENIKNISLPQYDPVFGTQGPLELNWK
jgi:uncharacterized protein YjlB